MPLSVTINQAAGQSDPTSTSPINFTVVFSQPVIDFTGGVILSGTAGATTYAITGTGTTYNVAVSGMTGPGTVIASVAAGAAHTEGDDAWGGAWGDAWGDAWGALGIANEASTSTDNVVTFEMVTPMPTPTPSTGSGGGGGGYGGGERIDWSKLKKKKKRRRMDDIAVALMMME